METHQPSKAEAFEAGLLDHPDDLARWSAYSDYLTEQGDPRGEFMRVQLALEDETLSAEDRKKLKTAEAELLATHEREWLGPLAAFTVDGEVTERGTRMLRATRPPVTHRFERGWLAALNFFTLTVDQVRAYANSPAARMVREVTIEEVESEIPVGTQAQYVDSYYQPGPDVPADLDPYDTPALHTLCRCPHLPAVRTFRLGEEMVVDGSGEEHSNCYTNGALADQLVRQMPRVENLAFYARRLDAGQLFALPIPNLRSLIIYHGTRYPLDTLATNRTLTRLGMLRCHPHAMEYGDEEDGAYIRLRHLRAICRSPYLTNLTHLMLRCADFGDAGVEELITSGMFQRLKVLDLRAGCVTDDGAYRLLASPHLRQLEFLNLRNNALTEAAATSLVATGVNVDLSHQHSTTQVVDGEYVEFLYDGDIE